MDVNLAGGNSATGCTVQNSTGNLVVPVTSPVLLPELLVTGPEMLPLLLCIPQPMQIN